MKRILEALLGAAVAYVIGAVAGALWIEATSANTHDKSLEAVMTGAFVIGPLAAVAGFAAVVLFRFGGQNRRPARSSNGSHGPEEPR